MGKAFFVAEEDTAGAPREPERNLWASVLRRAIEDSTKHEFFAEIQTWMNHEHYSKSQGGFNWVCEVIGYNPEQIKEAINARIERLGIDDASLRQSTYKY